VARNLVPETNADASPYANGCKAEPNRYLLKALPKPDLDLVFQVGKVLNHQNRDYLVRQGEIGDGIHVILSGVVESTYAGPQGRELILATWREGDFVGAPYVLGEHWHSWSARALGHVISLHLDQRSMRRLIEQSPAFAISVIQCLGFKGETYSTLAQALAGQTVSDRLSLLLIKLCENVVRSETGTIPLGRITQANMGRMIGATRQSISLVLSRLQDDGIISIGPATIVVHDLSALRAQVGS
jgi:CRP-like cAMP-binding protein